MLEVRLSEVVVRDLAAGAAAVVIVVVVDDFRYRGLIASTTTGLCDKGGRKYGLGAAVADAGARGARTDVDVIVIVDDIAAVVAVIVIVIIDDFRHGGLIASTTTGLCDEGSRKYGLGAAVADAGACGARTGVDVVIIVDDIAAVVAVIIIVDDFWSRSLVTTFGTSRGNYGIRSRSFDTAVAVVVVIHNVATVLVHVVVIIRVASAASVIVVVRCGDVCGSAVDTYNLCTPWAAFALGLATLGEICTNLRFS